MDEESALRGDYMPYLYGDSTPSTLEINYIDFLRDALDFAAHVLVADERQREGSARAEELRRAAEIEVARLEAFGDTVSRAVMGAMSASGTAASVTACAQSVMRSSADVVGAAMDRVRAEAEGDIARFTAQADRDRGGAVQALGTLLLRHDLPDATTEIHVTLGEGSRHAAQLHVLALDDLRAVVDLDIAEGHAFSHALRVDKLVERLEVHAPEISGWLRKEVKLKPQRLDREYITALTVSGSETRISMRSSVDGVGAGYDVVVKRTGPRVNVSLMRVGESAELPAFDLTDDDETRMVDLEEKLVGSAVELMDARKTLVHATLGGQPLAGHPSPRAMVERLVDAMAPVVREIAQRSLTPNELVLKRLLDNGRREEIFLARRELAQKFEGLADGGRAILAALGLGDPALVVTASPPAVLAQQPVAVVAPVPTPEPAPPPAPPPPEPAQPPAAAPSDEDAVFMPAPVPAPVVASQPPSGSFVPSVRATESQRPGPVAPRPGSLVPPRPSRPTPAPVPAPPPPDDEGWDGGKPKMP
jgi:hypothetical protein